MPTPIPTPTPVPTPTPDPNVPPAGSGCGKPYPPMITRFGVKVLYEGRSTTRWTRRRSWGPTSSTASRSASPTGARSARSAPKGPTDREACEVWRSGIAKDTGQPGPTWTWIENGTGRTSYCSSAAGAPCDKSPTGPFTVKAFKGGLYRICTEAGACGETEVSR